MNAKTWTCVALATAIAAVTNCAVAQTWTGPAGSTWTQPDPTHFSPEYTSGSTATFTSTGAGTVTVDAGGVTPGAIIVESGTYTFTGDSIGGTGGLTKNGTGTLTLSGTNNTYSGTTTLNAGTLKGLFIGASLNPVLTFGTGSILINGGTLELRTTENITFGNDVTVSSNATIYAGRDGGSANKKTISLGTVSIGSNTLTIDGSNVSFSLAFAAINLTGDAILSFDDRYLPLTVGAVTESGGARSLTKAGDSSSTLTIAGSSDYTGATTISSGTLQLGNAGATGSLTGTSAIINNGRLTIKRTNTFTQVTDLNNKPITGSGSFTQAGSGTTILSLDNSFTGSTYVSDGTLVLAGSNCLSDTNVLSIASGKFVQLEAGVKEKVGILKLLRLSSTEPQLDGIWGATGNTAAQYTCAELLGDGLLYVNTDLPASGTLISFQ